jgi:hypothetical protein
LETLTYAHENGCPWNQQTCTFAAIGGSLKCLKYAHEHGCPWDISTFGCARADAMIRYLILNGCPGHVRADDFAAKRANLELLQFARETECLWTAVTCEKAVFFNALPCLTYAHKQGCP